MSTYTEGPLRKWHTDRADEVTADQWNDQIHNLFEQRDASGRNCMDYLTRGDLETAMRHAWQGTAYQRKIQELLCSSEYDAHYLKPGNDA